MSASNRLEPLRSVQYKKNPPLNQSRKNSSLQNQWIFAQYSALPTFLSDYLELCIRRIIPTIIPFQCLQQHSSTFTIFLCLSRTDSRSFLDEITFDIPSHSCLAISQIRLTRRFLFAKALSASLGIRITRGCRNSWPT